ncbi:hypothetical protein C9374_008172 [Naegleria lovaniensis]|uniref:Ras family small GTPase n=1 Tax=Naegleria lovaniensis TaxID=51637 RepID=A0AA88GLS6_NAELO|nr:uncharacterized protein C9374_008172 [Naegleria lovaniensis]KAG2378533.1 hypothetical protein C9374_008172 [Naegleria lovaniensis]
MSSSKTSNPPDRFKLAVVGTGAVGKSAITIQFTQNIFDTDEVYDPTIEDAYYVKRMIDGVSCELEIVDTAGQDDYVALRDTYMKSCYGFALVFDLTSQTTLEELKIFVEQINRIKMEENKPVNGNYFPAVLLGNKCDLNYSLTEKEVTNYMKKELGIHVPVLFTSAKTRTNIEEAFEVLIKEMRIFRDAQSGKPPKKESGGLFGSISSHKDSDRDLQAFKEQE